MIPAWSVVRTLPLSSERANGEYYLANSVVYETTWDNAITAKGNPCQMPTETQATDSQGNLLYNQVQYVYRDADGKKVNSNEDWSCKFPVTDYTIVPNEVKSDGSIVDNRGAVAKAVDRINYVTSIMNDTLKPAADNAFKNISVARTGLNDTNFNILTFSKMTDIARNIEKNFTVDLEYHYDKVVLGKDGKPVIDEATGEAKTEDAVKKELGVSPASAASTVQNCIDNGKSYTYVTHSSLSSAAVAEYTRLFNIFASAAVERGYQGAQLEKEIKCASGNIYSTLTATKAVYAEDGKTVTTEASVSKKTGANAPRFGKWDNEGKLVNDGSYSAESWTRYVRALAAAVALAQYGNGDYAHKDSANFVLSDKKGYDASLTNIYTVDTELQAAEIALAPAEVTNSTVTVNAVEGATVTINGNAYAAPVSVETGSTITIDVKAAEGYQVVNELTINGEKVTVNAFPYEYKVDGDVTIAPSVKQAAADTITVSGKVLIAANTTGTKSTKGIVGIDVVANGEVVATSAADGSFTATVPVGTTELTIQRKNVTINRTVTLSGTKDISNVEIPVCICNYNGDTTVNALDKSTFATAYGNKDKYNIYCDLNGDGAVNSLDKSTFAAFFGNKVEYATLALA